MALSLKQGRPILFFLVFLSGAAGLVYQVVWHKYLSILLGAQARATAVVLAIFLGGISLGYHVFGRWSRDTKWNLLLGFSVIELLLGFWAFFFPSLFRLTMLATPMLYQLLGVNSLLIDVFLSILLIGFPTFLMGGTLPLLTQGLGDDFKEASRTHARIYGVNTVGACFGSLAAGYVLVPATDLPCAALLAGVANFIVGTTTYFLFVKKQGLKRDVTPSMATVRRSKITQREILIFAIGIGSGFYLITLETVLIRLMGLSTGASNYNFTLIVSLFVLALGVGSLVPARVASFTDRHLLRNQVGVALLLFFLYLTGDRWSYWVHLIRIVFRDNIQNFYYYHAALGSVFFLLLALPIGMCGFTLPLCFHLLKERKETLGHRVGQLYGLNTLGCVAGALVGGYLLLYVINLDELFKVCVGVSVVTALLAARLVLLGEKKGAPLGRDIGFASACLSLAVTGLLLAPVYHKDRFIQPFRQQSPLSISYDGPEAFGRYLSATSDYLWYKDGPNTSVGVGVTSEKGKEKSRTIFVNGKSDGNTRGDFLTMALTGHIPGLFAPKLDNVCVVGFGTGITTGALLQYEQTKHVEVVDIADTVLAAAKYFDKYNGGVTKSPKVKLNAMDAFRFLGGNKQKYDVIISEPSNPWVAGVENLFSAEFYEMAKSRLEPKGVFVQWVQMYSFDDELLKMVLRTITSQFKHVTVFQMLEHDLALVATPDPLSMADIVRAHNRFNENALVRHSLDEGGINRFEAVLGLELIPSAVTAIIAGEGAIHRLETPRLSHGAAKTFFTAESARVHTLRRSMKEYYPAITKHSLISQYLAGRVAPRDMIDGFRHAFCDSGASRNRSLCEEAVAAAKVASPSSPYEAIYDSVFTKAEYKTLTSFSADRRLPKSFSAGDLNDTQKMFELYKRVYSPIARLPVRAILERLEDGCLKQVKPDKELHGDCLLEAAAVMEVASPEPDLFIPLAKRYSDWFSRLPATMDGYERFRKANEIILRLQREMVPETSHR